MIGKPKRNYRETKASCAGCGTTYHERVAISPQGPHGLSDCPFCDAEKCAACDMGDDVGEALAAVRKEI